MTSRFHKTRKRIGFLAAGTILATALVAYPIFKKSPDAAFDIYILGASTAKGEPYAAFLDVGALAGHCLGDNVNGRPVRVTNLAIGGKPISYARKALGKIGKDADLVLLYSGHNEFLKYDRDHDLSQNRRMLCDQATVSLEEKNEVLKKYAESVEAIILYCRKKKIPLVLSTVAANLADMEPNRSVCANPSNAEKIEARMKTAAREMEKENWTGALEHYRAILDLEPGFALAHYLSGHCHARMEQFERARNSYLLAKDNDGNPYRVLSAQNDMVKRLAKKHAVLLLDAETVIENASPSRLPGYDLFWDNCHPTLQGYALIAEELARIIEKRFGVRRAIARIDLDEIGRRFNLAREAEFTILISRAQYMYRIATLVWNPETRLRQAELYLDRADHLLPNHPEFFCAKATVLTLRGEREPALTFWKKAFDMQPDVVRKKFKNRYLRETLKRIQIEDTGKLIDQFERQGGSEISRFAG